jgi:hypothetical protein
MLFEGFGQNRNRCRHADIMILRDPVVVGMAEGIPNLGDSLVGNEPSQGCERGPARIAA